MIAPATRTRPRPDAVTLLTIYLALAFALPARMVVPGFGAAGRPAALLGVVMVFIWIVDRAGHPVAQRAAQPVRWIAGALLVVTLMSYLAGLERGLRPEELSGADRSVLLTFSMIGVALVAADGISDRDRLDTLLIRLVYGGALLSITGALQFFFDYDIASRIKVPGLILNGELVGASARGDVDLTRVAGLAGHYIEYGVVLAMIVPIAVHYLLYAPSKAQRQRVAVATAIVALGVPLSISRSAALGLFVALGGLALAWSWRFRLNALFVAIVAAIAARSVLPGLLGTIQALFTNLGNDPSVEHRTDDYSVVFHYFGERPVLGRGTGTFLPEYYRLLDNQILGTLVSVGLLGLAAVLAIWFGTMSLGRRVLRRAADEETRHLGHVLAVSAAVAFVVSFTFDSLFFSMFSATTMLTFGAAGALWRMQRELASSRPRPPGENRSVPILAARLRVTS